MRDRLSRSDVVFVGFVLSLLAMSISLQVAYAVSSSPAYQLKIVVYSDSSLTTPTDKVAPSGSLFIDVILVDQSGNPVVNPGPVQIQVSLSTTGGVLTSTNAYINAGSSDTASSFGPIVYDAPAHSGLQRLTATGAPLGSTFTAEEKIHVSP